MTITNTIFVCIIMSPEPRQSISENDNRNVGNNNVDNDDSGVSVSGSNLSQSDSTSGSGSDGGDEGAGATTNVVQEGNSKINRQALNTDQVNSSNSQERYSRLRPDPEPMPNRQEHENIESNRPNVKQEEASVHNNLLDVQHKAESLAKFIIAQTLGSNTTPKDEIEETLLRCAKALTNKHNILFNGMMRRIRINEDTAYTAFNTVANELFEGERHVVNWGRIVTFYAFGGQLALYCKEQQLICGERIPMYVGRYAKDIISNFVYKEGGWTKLCEEFPPEDEFESTVWRFLTWTAVGLGLATAASFLASN